jgi:cellulose synthase operon protein C
MSSRSPLGQPGRSQRQPGPPLRCRWSRRWASALCLGLLLGNPLLPPLGILTGVAQEAVPTAVRQGFTWLGRGLVNDAIAVFQGAVRRYPNSLEAKLGLAIAYRRAGKDLEAWQTYQTVLVQDPQNSLALKTLGVLGGFRPEWQQPGIAALTTLLTLHPTDSEARAQRAQLYGYQGRFSEAIADYEIALQGRPSADTLVGAAQIYTYSGNYARGLELFNRARSLGPQGMTGNAAIAYARALRGVGNAALAVQTLRSQLTQKLDATALHVRSELSQAYLDNQQPAEALAVLDPLRDRRDARLPLARALNELGQRQTLPLVLAEAADLYKQALNETPNPPAMLLQEVADVLGAMPQEQAYALQLYRQLQQQYPGNASVSWQQVVLESQLGMISRAETRQRLQGLLVSLPKDTVGQTAIARALIRLDPDPELLEVYQRLLPVGVNVPFLQIRVAQILIEQNDLVGAQAAIAAYRATPTGAQDQTPELLLAELERRQGKLEASAQRYQALMANTAEASTLHSAAIRGLAGIRLAQQRPVEALALYDVLLANHSQDLSLHLARTSVAYQAGQITEAAATAVLNQWLQSRPANDMPRELYSLVGVLPASAQRESLYATLIAADSNYVPVQVRYVELLAKRDPQLARAEMNRLLDRVRQTAPDDRNRSALALLQGQLAQALGDFSQADDAYARVLAEDPVNLDALLAWGGIRVQQRRYEAAMALYNRALSLKPDDVGVRRSLAELAAAQGNPLTALEQLERIELEQGLAGNPDGTLAHRRQQIQENLLRQRGFQPPWERY